MFSGQIKREENGTLSLDRWWLHLGGFVYKENKSYS